MPCLKFQNVVLFLKTLVGLVLPEVIEGNPIELPQLFQGWDFSILLFYPKDSLETCTQNFQCQFYKKSFTTFRHYTKTEVFY